MSKRPPYLITSFAKDEVTQVNKTITTAYQSRLESLALTEDSGTSQRSHQSAQHGDVTFSANGSANIVKSFGLQEKQNKIVYAAAHASHNRFIASVTDVTLTGLTITLGMVSGTDNVSDVTTAAIRVWYQVIGSNP